MNKKLLLAICCYHDHDPSPIISACENLGIDYNTIDLMAENWLEQCNAQKYDAFLIRPTCRFEEHKSIFDERCYYLQYILNKVLYPNFDELFVYENKRNMANCLSLMKFPYPRTNVLASKKAAIDFVNDSKFPLVVKGNIGAGGSAVRIIRDKKSYLKLVNRIFGTFHPDFAIGSFPKFKKFGISLPRISRSQRHYMICQECIDVRWEWRLVRIGDSFFGHKKLIGDNGFASGSNLVGWEEPPKELLDMLFELTNELGSRSMALDVFEDVNGKYYINELQTIFGAYAPSQMYLNGIPGRFLRMENGEYKFEEGEFCKNACWDLRVEDLMVQLNEKI